MRKSLWLWWRGISVLLLLGITFTGCKKSTPTEQAAVPPPPVSSAPTPDSTEPAADPGDPSRRLKPTYEQLCAVRDHPLTLVASAFDLGLSTEQIDQMAANPDHQTISVASAEGKLILTIEEGQLKDVEQETGAAVPAAGPAEDPDSTGD
jgi:hypothetical protein